MFKKKPCFKSVRPLRLPSRTQTRTWEITRPIFGSVEISAEYERWSVQDLQQREDSLVQAKRTAEMTKWSDREKKATSC